jgi:hypothetical protein
MFSIKHDICTSMNVTLNLVVCALVYHGLFSWFYLDSLASNSPKSCILMLDAVELPLVDRRDVAKLNGLR